MTVTGCAAKTIKFLVFLFNFIVVICGMGLLGGGGAVLASDAVYRWVVNKLPDELQLAQLNSALYICMLVGTFLLLIGFCGCCGAACENLCLLGTYAFVMVLLLIVQFGGGIGAVVFKDKVKMVVIDNVLSDSANKLAHGEPEVRNATCRYWTELQDHLQCCGVNGTFTELEIKENCPELVDPSNCGSFTQGCGKVIWSKLKECSAMAAGVLLGLLLLEILALVFACKLCNQIRKERRGYKYT